VQLCCVGLVLDTIHHTSHMMVSYLAIIEFLNVNLKYFVLRRELILFCGFIIVCIYQKAVVRLSVNY